MKCKNLKLYKLLFYHCVFLLAKSKDVAQPTCHTFKKLCIKKIRKKINIDNDKATKRVICKLLLHKKKKLYKYFVPKRLYKYGVCRDCKIMKCKYCKLSKIDNDKRHLKTIIGMPTELLVKKLKRIIKSIKLGKRIKGSGLKHFEQLKKEYLFRKSTRNMK